jgi:hypothetical protein
MADNLAESTPRVSESGIPGLSKAMVSLLIFVLIGYLFWNYGLAPNTNVSQPPNPSPPSTGALSEALNSSDASNVSNQDKLKNSFDGLNVSLANREEDASQRRGAKTQLKQLQSDFSEILNALQALDDSKVDEPGMRSLAETIEKFSEKFESLDLEQYEGISKIAFSKLIDSFLGSVDELTEKVPTLYRPMVKPSIDRLVDRLKQFR